MGERSRFWIRIAVGVALIALGLVVSRNAFNTGAGWGADLAQLYLSGWMLREGRNIYDLQLQHQGYMQHIGYITTWGHFYPPAPAVVMLPVTLISYPAARELYFVVLVVGMFLTLWRFMEVFAPHWDKSMRVLVLGLITCAATTRWSFKVAQPGPLVLGLFGLFLTELKTERWWLAFLSASAVTSIKVTFGLPFVLVAAAHRRFKLGATIVGLSVVLNLIGMFGMGGPKILADYQANMADFERPDQLNYPDPRGGNSLARTDWPYILNAISPDFARSRMIGYVLTLLALTWLAWQVWHARERIRNDIPTLVLTGPVVAISMLAVYHHHYDMNIMLLPVIAYLAHPEIRRRPVAWLYILPVGLYAGLYPYEKFARVVEGVLGPGSVVLTRPLACAVCIVALVSSSVLLRQALDTDSSRSASSLGQ